MQLLLLDPKFIYLQYVTHISLLRSHIIPLMTIFKSHGRCLAPQAIASYLEKHFCKYTTALLYSKVRCTALSVHRS